MKSIKYKLIIICIFINNLVAQSISTSNINEIGPTTEKVQFDNYKNIIYVSNSEKSDYNGDGTKTNPWKNVTDAVNSTNDSDRTAILVSEGDYIVNPLVLKQNVDFYGGFKPITWERNIHDYKTILNGNNQNRVLVGSDSSRVDGFVIKNGLSSSNGGGILCDDTSPTISNCFIINNRVSEPENFNHTRIHQDGNHGAGIACLFNSVPIIRNNIFYNNQTEVGNGAGIAFYGWNRNENTKSTGVKDNKIIGGVLPLVKNNVFINNTTGIKDIYGTRSSNGGAISCAYEARPLIENNIIINNHALGRGDAGGIYSEYFSYPIIKNNWILGNTSDDDGGGIYLMKLGHATISNNFIAGNKTLGQGVGGIRISKEGRADIANNILVHNLTGGAIDCVDGYMLLENNLIMDNKGRSSIRYYSHFTYFNSSIVRNNIIRQNENNMIIETFGGSDVLIQNNNIDEDSLLKGNTNNAIDLTDGEVSLKIKDIYYDDILYQSIIRIKKHLLNESLTGRAVNLNEFWSVVANIEGNRIFVWGDATDYYNKDSKLKVIPSYIIKKN